MRSQTTEYKNISGYLKRYRSWIKSRQGNTDPKSLRRVKRYEEKLRELSKKQKSLPAGDPLDSNYRRLRYVRYADDTLIGIIGSKEEAEKVYTEVVDFLNTSLNLTIAEEKSGIHHAKEGVPFLGYVVQNYTSEKVVTIHQRNNPKVVATRRSVHDRMQLRVPQKQMSEFCQPKGYGSYERLRPSSKPIWRHLEDAEILLGYNAEMRGLANYYALANEAKGGLHKLMFLAMGSFLATLATKHQSSISKEYARRRQGHDIVVTVTPKKGKQREYTLFKLRNWEPTKVKPEDVNDTVPTGNRIRFGRSSLEQRINANICESCGKEGGHFEVHHVRKLKNLQGKEWWEQMMIARKRETIVLCMECHDLLHAGRLYNRQKKF